MDIVNKAVNAASTTFWGENNPHAEQSSVPHGEEPISGVQGKGATTDPYDAGNREGKVDMHDCLEANLPTSTTLANVGCLPTKIQSSYCLI